MIKIPSNTEIRSNIEGLKYIFKQKRVMRYDAVRTHLTYEESVADHVFGLMILANYFLPKVDPEELLDKSKISSLCLYHDISEVEVGDVIYNHKTPEHVANEEAHIPKVLSSIPTELTSEVSDLLEEYKLQETSEARFVKALDKFEPALHLLSNPSDSLLIMKSAKVDRKTAFDGKFMAVQEFPIITEYLSVLQEMFDELGLYYEKNDR